MFKRLHPFHFCNDESLIVKTSIKNNNPPPFPIFQPLTTTCWFKKFSVYIYRLASYDAVRCRQLLCRSCLTGLYTQFYVLQAREKLMVGNLCRIFCVIHGTRQFTSPDNIFRTMDAILRQLYFPLSHARTHTRSHIHYVLQIIHQSTSSSPCRFFKWNFANCSISPANELHQNHLMFI
jgi:hypothetical protein